jgi:hypothetical protein
MTRLIVKQPAQQQRPVQQGTCRRDNSIATGDRDSVEGMPAGAHSSSSREAQGEEVAARSPYSTTFHMRRSPTAEQQRTALHSQHIIRQGSPSNHHDDQQAARGLTSERMRANHTLQLSVRRHAPDQCPEIMRAAGGRTEWPAQRKAYNGADDSGYNSADEYEDTQGSREDEVWKDAVREKKFEEDLWKEKGLILRKCKEDGNCLFRAISDQVRLSFCV